MTDTVKAYIRTLKVEELNRLLEVNGHRAWFDPTDVDMIRGYVFAMVAQGSIVIEDDVSPFTAITREQYDTEIHQARIRSDDAKTKGTKEKYRNAALALHNERRLIPSVAVEDAKERAEALEQHAARKLRNWIEEARQKREKLAERILENDASAMYSIEWLSGTAKALKLAALAAHALALAEDHPDRFTAVTAAQAVAQDEQQKLDYDSYRGASSSAWSNAKDAEERAAALDFISFAERGW